MSWLIISIGAFIGACLRFYLSIRLNGRGQIGTAGTWLANMAGSALLALLWALPSPDWLWQFAGTGFAGAFTTFSTFGKETVDLLEKNKRKAAFLYVFFSILVSFLIVGTILILFSSQI